MKKIESVAVLGAGLAGLSCARHLQQQGLEVRLFDKSRGPAGRMSTRRGDDWQCDHGAQYFTARDPDFRAEVARWEALGVAARWQPRLEVFGGAELHTLDETLERFVGTPRMTAPARSLALTLDLRLQHTVNRLLPAPSGWRLGTLEQGELDETFDAVVLAVPAPQAAPLLAPFHPQFAGIATLARMRPSWALMLRYDAPLDLHFDAAFVNHGPLRWIARDSHKPGRGPRETWLLHATPEWSTEHLEEPPEAVAEALLAAFAKLGADTPPAAWSAHRWRFADTEPALDRACCWDEDRRIGLCGDWLNGGKVEGAWVSGRALARRIGAAATVGSPLP